MEKLTVPPDRLAVPRRVAPSKNCTVPVGVPDPGLLAATVAVNVTQLPKVNPGGEDEEVVMVVVVGVLLTICFILFEEEVVKFVSPG